MSDDSKIYEALGRIEANQKTHASQLSDMCDRLRVVEKHVSLVKNVWSAIKMIFMTIAAVLTLNWGNISKIWHH